MTIIRSPNPHAVIRLSLIEDTNLSWGARGLMAYIESRPDDWKFNTNELLGASGDALAPFISTRAIVDGLVDELLAAGYLVEDGSA